MRVAHQAGIACPLPEQIYPGQTGYWLQATRLPGEPAQDLSVDQLACLLAQLHAVDVRGVPLAETGQAERAPWAGCAGVLHGKAMVLGHFDVFTDNVLIQERQISGLVDWEFAGRGPRVLDLAIAALGYSQSQPKQAFDDLATLVLVYQSRSGVSLCMEAVCSAYQHAVELFCERRRAMGSPRPVQALLDCADIIERSS